jgi:hypothetical protein
MTGVAHIPDVQRKSLLVLKVLEGIPGQDAEPKYDIPLLHPQKREFAG